MSQCLEALAVANDVRNRRFELKQRIELMPSEAGREVVISILLYPGELWDTAKLDRVLRMPFKAGPLFSKKIRRTGGMDLRPDKTVGSLTDRQRDLLVDAIRRYGRKR